MSVNLFEVDLAWFFKKFRIIFQILLWWFVERVEWTIKADISILRPLFFLIAVSFVGLFEIINNLLLDARLHFNFLLFEGSQRKLEAYFGLQGPSGSAIHKSLTVFGHKKLQR